MSSWFASSRRKFSKSTGDGKAYKPIESPAAIRRGVLRWLYRQRVAIVSPLLIVLIVAGAPFPAIVTASAHITLGLALLVVARFRRLPRNLPIVAGFIDAAVISLVWFFCSQTQILSVVVFCFTFPFLTAFTPLLRPVLNFSWTCWTLICLLTAALAAGANTSTVIMGGVLLGLAGFGNLVLVTRLRAGYKSITQYFGFMHAQHERRTRKTKERADFLANMNHELRTPLNGILGMTTLLIDSPLSNEQRDYAKTIRTSSELLLAMINDILDMSRIESGFLHLERKPFDPLRVIKLVIENLQPAARDKDVAIDLILKRRLPRTLLGDAARLSQILFNLIGNAVKFTPKGSVTIRIGFDQGVELREKSVFRVDVSDTGIGIAPDAIPHIFETYRQASAEIQKRFGGTGLGLAITRELIVRLGGEITVESRVGKGSTFRVSIPYLLPEGKQEYHAAQLKLPFGRGQDEALDSAEADGGAYAIGGQSALINQEGESGHEGLALVADDNAINLQLLCRLVHRLGFESVQAINGIEALTAIIRKDQTRTFSFAILDYQMPGLNGGDVVRSLYEWQKTSGSVVPPVIILSGHGAHHLTPLSQEFPGIEILEKPIRLHQLQEAIQRVIHARK